MKRLIENYKERFRNRGMSNYVGLKVTGLIVLVGILIFAIVLLLSETVFAAELPLYFEGAVAALNTSSIPIV